MRAPIARMMLTVLTQKPPPLVIGNSPALRKGQQDPGSWPKAGGYRNRTSDCADEVALSRKGGRRAKPEVFVQPERR